ncbi:MAG: hypothetical protein LBO65_02470, partial [Spirochaetaceae bacterium]|nr:hypothetical protein [Spirochaetaceae bacterium]
MRGLWGQITAYVVLVIQSAGLGSFWYPGPQTVSARTAALSPADRDAGAAIPASSAGDSASEDTADSPGSNPGTFRVIEPIFRIPAGPPAPLGDGEAVPGAGTETP